MSDLSICFHKKLASLIEKWILYPSYAIVIAAILVAPMKIVAVYIIAVLPAINIPWFVYLIIAAVLALPTYALAWCVEKELTNEDWYSIDAFVFVLVGFVIVLLVEAALFNVVFPYSEPMAVGVWFVTALVTMSVACIFVGGRDLRNPVSFPGALVHHIRTGGK